MYSVEKNIQHSIDSGDFENLADKDKPIKLAQHPHEHPGLRLFTHIIRNAGFTFPWIENRKAIPQEIHLTRQHFKHAWERYSPDTETDAPTVVSEANGQTVIEKFTIQVESINKKINLNILETTLISLQLPPLNVKRELELTIKPASDTLPPIESPI